MSRFISFKLMAVSFVMCLLFAGFSSADTFTVMNLEDTGEGSLRQAIIDANENNNAPGVVDEIVFADGLTGTIMFPDVSQSLLEPTKIYAMRIIEDVNIIGPGKDVITIDGNNVDNIITIAEDQKKLVAEPAERIKVSISGLTFANGQTSSTLSGGAIFNRGELRVEACEFSKNSAAAFGGAIYNDRGAIITEIKDSDFIMNSARVGGAIGLIGIPDLPDKLAVEETEVEKTLAVLSDSNFDQNTAEVSGGALSSASEATIGIISGTTFSNNIATERFGGAIYIDAFTNIFNEESVGTRELEEEEYHLDSLTDSEFTNNSSGSGGAILNNFGKIKLIADCTFVGNNAIMLEDPNPGPKTLAEAPEFPEPNENVGGGAIGNAGGTIEEITRSTFSLNTTQGFGGAIVNAAVIQLRGGIDPIRTAAPAIPEFTRSVIMNLNNSTFDENIAGVSGGAFANGSSSVEMLNVSYSENKAAQNGGALYNLNSVESMPGNGGGEEQEEIMFEQFTADIQTQAAEEQFSEPIAFVSFTTFARNEAGMEGGAIHEQMVEEEPDPKSIHLRHSILALNVGGNCGGVDADDEGGNHSDDDTCPLIDGNMATIVLGPLSDNGGPTKTVPLLEGDPVDSAVECTAITMFGVISEAIDPVLPVDEDQRGAPRAFGDNCDAGAFEFGAVAPGGFFHNSITPAIANNINSIMAEEATPGGRVAFVWGPTPGSVILGGKLCNGLEIEIRRPKLLGFMNADADGIAELIFFIPQIGDFEIPWLTQAIDVKSCATSEVIQEIITKQ